MAVWGTHGRFNQAGDLAPRTSPYGDALRAGLSQIVTNPRPIGMAARARLLGFGGTIGAVVTANGNAVTVVALDTRYSGDAPQSLQPFVDVSDPWLR